MSASTGHAAASGRHRRPPTRTTEPATTGSKLSWALVVLIIAVVVMAVLPDLVHFLNVKHDNDIIDFERTTLSKYVSVAAAVGLVLVCSVIIFWRGRPRGSVTGLIVILLALLVPYIISPGLPVKADMVKVALAAAVVLAIWKVGAPVDVLKWVSISGSVIGVYSIIGGLIAPEYINYRDDAVKSFIGNWQLAGPFVHSNVLALYCVLALALSPLIVSIRWRIFHGLILITTIAASASRTALIATGILALWWLFCRFRPMKSVRLVGTALICVCATAVLIIPLLKWDPYAFTGRGYAWASSLRTWQESRLVGLGLKWYTTTGHTSDPASWAFRSGHNLFIDTLAKSGLVGIGLLVLVLLAATRATRALPGSTQQIACFGYLIAFLISSTMETTWFLVPTMGQFPVVGLVFAVLVAGGGTSDQGSWPSLARLRSGFGARRRSERPEGRND